MAERTEISLLLSSLERYSVLSAIEGLELVTPISRPYILAITIPYSFGVALSKGRGTARALLLRAHLAVFFLGKSESLGAAAHIGDAPRILLAFNHHGLPILWRVLSPSA